MKRLLTVLLAIAMTLSLCACGAKDAGSTANGGDRKTLIVGFDAEFPPYGYMDEKGEYVGFDLDLAQEVCKRRGWELVKQPIDWDAKDMELSSGSIDCIWNGFTINGREDSYTFSVPYVDNSQVYVVKSGSDIKTEADLAGKKIAYVPGTMHHILLLDILKRNGLDPNKDVTLVRIDFFDMGQALADGTIDAFCSGEPYPSQAVLNGSGKILEYPYFKEGIGTINAVMITTEDEIKNNPDMIKAAVDAHIKATDMLMNDTDAWMEKSAEFGNDKATLEYAVDNMELFYEIYHFRSHRFVSVSDRSQIYPLPSRNRSRGRVSCRNTHRRLVHASQ